MRTTSPTPVYRSTRDTRNAPLWNPRSRELLNVEEDDAGRLAGFRARFGGGFDAHREVEVEEVDSGKKATKANVEAKGEQEEGMEVREPTERQREVEMKVESTKKEKQRLQQQKQQTEEEEVDEGWDFGEDDENMLDLISRFGQDESGIHNAPIVKKKQK